MQFCGEINRLNSCPITKSIDIPDFPILTASMLIDGAQRLPSGNTLYIGCEIKIIEIAVDDVVNLSHSQSLSMLIYCINRMLILAL